MFSFFLLDLNAFSSYLFLIYFSFDFFFNINTVQKGHSETKNMYINFICMCRDRK